MIESDQISRDPSTISADPSVSTVREPARRSWRRVVAGAAATLVLGAGLSGCYGHHSHHWGKGEGLSPERISKVVDKVFSRVDASDAQKADIADIVERATLKLRLMKGDMRETRTLALDLLTGPEVDRVGLEALRVSRLGMTEDASKVLSQALADVAEVLTPEQRAKAHAKITDRFKSRS